MSSDPDSVYVYAQPRSSAPPVIARRLDFYRDRVDFRYGKSWLDNPRAFAFHSDMLPLTEAIYSTKTLDGALSVFRDAGPGAWGGAS